MSPIDSIENSLVYYIALQKAKVHAEYHIYAKVDTFWFE